MNQYNNRTNNNAVVVLTFYCVYIVLCSNYQSTPMNIFKLVKKVLEYTYNDIFLFSRFCLNDNENAICYFFKNDKCQ